MTSSADLPGYLGCGSIGNTAAVVGDGQAVVPAKLDFDAVGMARDSLVHAIVDDFGGKVMERSVIGAADVHAGPSAHGFQALEDLDRGSVIAVGRGRSGRRKQIGH